MIPGIKAAKEAGATDEQLDATRKLQRRAHCESTSSTPRTRCAFTPPQEAARILGEAIDYASQGRIEVAKLGTLKK
jgi:nitrite reductase (cytochrome c-552)